MRVRFCWKAPSTVQKTPVLTSSQLADRIEIASRGTQTYRNAAVRRDARVLLSTQPISYSSPDCTPTTSRRGKDMVFLEHIGFGGRDRQLWMYYWDMRDGADFCGVSCHLF